jgi:hypothetical protein
MRVARNERRDGAIPRFSPCVPHCSHDDTPACGGHIASPFLGRHRALVRIPHGVICVESFVAPKSLWLAEDVGDLLTSKRNGKQGCVQPLGDACAVPQGAQAAQKRSAQGTCVCQRSAPVYAAFASSKPHVPVRRDLQSRLQRTGLVRAPALQCLNHCCCWFLKMARLLVKRNAAVSRVAPTRFFA